MTNPVRACWLILTAVLATGCASSQHAGKHMQASESGSRVIVPVELDDYVIRMPSSIAPGDVTLQVKNVGHHAHNIKISGQGVKSQLPKNLQSGESADLELRLEAGTYKVTCPVGPHALMGMRMTLTVEQRKS